MVHVAPNLSSEGLTVAGGYREGSLLEGNRHPRVPPEHVHPGQRGASQPDV